MKITATPSQKVFFTSDSHYGHSNMCKGISQWKPDTGQRDFDSIEKMNQMLIDSINSKVGENDVLFHLGDWSFGGIDNIWEFRKRIICKTIHIILGNHDHHIKNKKVLTNVHFDLNGNFQDGPSPLVYKDDRDAYLRVGAIDLFESINKVLDLEVFINEGNSLKKYNFILSHYPYTSWENMNKGVIQLHGHVHLPNHLKLNKGKALDVGVDGNDYVPYEVNEIIKIMENQPISTLVLPNDHHETEFR